ncbi:MAG TPA: NAD(P)-dependent oxidoreductase [Terracidiphilus sp.]|nr:NAD(P)-dependent oxidoreductase [Terracidiphilus sp.]
MRVAFLGLGKMGSPMARRLLAAAHEVTVWNRTRERADALASHGASVAATPADAAVDAEAVLTMLFDDAAHEEVLFGASGVMEALKPGALHISLGTISVALSERLTAEHARRGQAYVGAPVFGRPNVAEEGRLWIVMAGADADLSRARPLMEPLSRGISEVGREPRQAHALKLGGNFLISAMIHSLGEAFVYSESQGIEPEVFLEAVNSALFQSPFYAAYGKVMLHPPKEAGATIELGAKDLRLLREAAAGRQTRLSLAELLAEVFQQADQNGLRNEDWAVGQYLMAKRRGAENGSGQNELFAATAKSEK